MESDAEFVERIGNTPIKEIGIRDGARLFALARRGAAAQWRPISEAPRDGTNFMLWHAEWGATPRIGRVARYHKEIFVGDDGLFTILHPRPTHWQPLHLPPKESEAWPEGFYKIERSIMDRCASEGCGQIPSVRMERGGIGSVYCEPCARKIVAALGEQP